MASLAINGGKKLRTKKFPAYKTIGKQEKDALCEVIDSGILSAFLGTWHKKFYGGKQVQAFEEEWASFFGAKHAISVNSNTSGLIAAMGAIGLSPGDEVIVTPYSMTISASAPLFYGAIPVFADIESDYFCLDPKSIESKISEKTKAIIVVDLFGHPYDVDTVNKLARQNNLYLIEDAAQAPGGMLGNKYAGTFADIGIFSLNYHKHIHSGEGGIIVTDSDEMVSNLQLIRNHAEAVVDAKNHPTLINMVGFNFRMTELEAAVGRCQLKKLSGFVDPRVENALYLSDGLKDIPAISPPKIQRHAKHSFYVQSFKFDSQIAGLDRDNFINAVKAELPLMELREEEGVLIGCGYVRPLYLQPLYQKRIGFGNRGYPFNLAGDHISYEKGICPVAERMHFNELFTMDMCHPFMSKKDLDDIIAAFNKVWDNRSKLKRNPGL
jgi:dTDP-4-amino-4,6-dideoxygalactose transaminase